MKKNIETLQSKGAGFLQVISLAILLAFILPVMTNAQAGKTDFTGAWTLNEGKSTLPQGGMRMGGGNLVVKQEANLLTVERTRTGQDGQPVVMTMKYTLDGKESINTSPRGDSKSIAKWAADAKSITIATTRTMEMNGESRTIKSVETWTLTDVKTLTVASVRDGMDGEVKATLIYDKK